MPNPQMLWSRLSPPWDFVLDIFAVGEKQKLLINLASNDAHKTKRLGSAQNVQDTNNLLKIKTFIIILTFQ